MRFSGLKNFESITGIVWLLKFRSTDEFFSPKKIPLAVQLLLLPSLRLQVFSVQEFILLLILGRISLQGAVTPVDFLSSVSPVFIMIFMLCWRRLDNIIFLFSRETANTGSV